MLDLKTKMLKHHLSVFQVRKSILKITITDKSINYCNINKLITVTVNKEELLLYKYIKYCNISL